MSDDVTLKAVLIGEDRSLSKTMGKAGDSVDQVGKKSKLTGAAMKGALSAAVVTQVADAVVNFGRESIEAYRGAEIAQKQLEDAYKRFPKVASVNIDKLREYNQTLQDKGYADADDVAAGQAVLARYKMTGAQLKQMTPLLVDYANRTGKDIPSAAAALGKGLSGSSRLAKELGFSFKDAKDPAKNFDQILAGLKGTVGGYSATMPEAERNQKALEYSFGDLQEALGEKLLPVMEQATKIGLQMVNWISQNASWLGPLATGIALVTGAILLMNAAMAVNPIALVVIAIGALVGGLIWAYQNVEWFRNGVDTAFSAIGAAGRWLWNNALAPALRAIIQGFAWVVDGIAAFLDALGNVPGFGWAKSAAAGLRGVAQSARDAADGIRGIPEPQVNIAKAQGNVARLKKSIESIKGKIVEAKAKGDDRAVVNLKKKLSELKKRYDVAVNVYKTGISSIQVRAKGSDYWSIVAGRASGGPVRRGTPYIVGEQGWELFVPDSAGQILNQRQLAGSKYSTTAGAVGGGGPTSVLINLQGLNGGPRAFAEAIERELYNLARSRGPRGQLSFARR